MFDSLETFYWRWHGSRHNLSKRGYQKPTQESLKMAAAMASGLATIQSNLGSNLRIQIQKQQEQVLQKSRQKGWRWQASGEATTEGKWPDHHHHYSRVSISEYWNSNFGFGSGKILEELRELR